MWSTGLNVLGLILMTVGGIGAAIFTPAPRYNLDGSVSLAAESTKEQRVATHKRQKLVKPLLAMVGIGALAQLIATFI